MRTPAPKLPLRVPEHVLVRELGGEAVLLNLDSETYFGLDEVGLRMWTLLTSAPSLGAAVNALDAEFDAPAEQLRRDLEALRDELLAHGLLAADDAR